MFTWSSRDLPSRQGVLTGRNIMCEGTEVIQGAAFGFWTWDYAELPVLPSVSLKTMLSDQHQVGRHQRGQLVYMRLTGLTKAMLTN